MHLCSQGIPVVAYPQEMKVWATRAKWLCQSFDSGSKRMVEMVKDLLQFLNGDTKKTQTFLAATATQKH